jgi:predicted nucleic acid-binding protein
MILVDTCVISEMQRPTPSLAVLRWLRAVPDKDLRLSVLTLGELRKGAELLDPGARRTALERWLDGLVERFSDRILPIDKEIAMRWAVITASGRRAGRARPMIDTLLAATAVRHGLILATRNVADFEGTGAQILNPWDHEPPVR